MHHGYCLTIIETIAAYPMWYIRGHKLSEIAKKEPKP
jgi:hypothetical protein